MEPGTFSLYVPLLPVIHLKSAFISIKEKYVGQQLTKATKEELYQEFEILFERFDLKNLQIIIVQKDDHTIDINPVRPIDKWALRGILLTDEFE